tara:strand:+ start:887 stop:1798 length:912 start_codon:yes stop_codon:yes gene_type:complete
MIVVSGENLLDVFNVKNNNFNFVNGGAGYNTALALGRFKSKIYYLSNISNDFFGKKIYKQLKKNNINTKFITKSNHSTALAIVNKGKKTEYSFYLKNTAFRYAKNGKILKLKKNKIKLCYFTCLSIFLDPVAKKNIEIAKKIYKNSIVFLDPNIRQNIIDSKKKFINIFKTYMKYASLIKLSNEDLAYLKKNKSVKNTISNWITRYNLSAVILTKGKKGATVYTKKFSISKNSIKVKVKDTVGAGDVFSAGIIRYFEKKNLLDVKKIKNLSKKNWLSALEYANLVAAKSCTREGCNPYNITLV